MNTPTQLLLEVKAVNNFNTEDNRKKVVQIFEQVKKQYYNANLKSSTGAISGVEVEEIQKIKYGSTNMKDQIDTVKKYLILWADEIVSASKQ